MPTKSGRIGKISTFIKKLLTILDVLLLLYIGSSLGSLCGLVARTEWIPYHQCDQIHRRGSPCLFQTPKYGFVCAAAQYVWVQSN